MIDERRVSLAYEMCETRKRVKRGDKNQMALFESYERRIPQINAVLNSYGISSIEEAEKITKDAGLDVYTQIKNIQPICFENACWAYIVGAAIAIKKGAVKAADAVKIIDPRTDKEI